VNTSPATRVAAGTPGDARTRWETPVAHLQAARRRIDSDDPRGAIAECHAAWASAGPLIERTWDAIAKEIDRGSPLDPSLPTKSARVKGLRDWAEKFSHPGAHPEAFKATMEDAWLAYQISSSLLFYFSEKIPRTARNASRP